MKTLTVILHPIMNDKKQKKMPERERESGREKDEFEKRATGMKYVWMLLRS